MTNNAKFVTANIVILITSIAILYWLTPSLINGIYLQYNETKIYQQLQAENQGIAYYKTNNIALTKELAMSYDYMHGTQLSSKLPAGTPTTTQAQIDKLSVTNNIQITEKERELARLWWCNFLKIVGSWIVLTLLGWVTNNFLDCCFKKKIDQLFAR